MMSVKKVANKNQEKQRLQQRSFNKLFLLVLIIIPTIIYYQSLNNELVNLDDGTYITTNPDVKTLHHDGLSATLKKTFTSYKLGNYHPLTMLSYCVEYNKYKLNSKTYHVTNLILHLLNTLLVFCFIWLLTQQQWVAFITALLFAIHPMHVESVAWVAERKDVLYSFFYLAALCTYVLHLQKEKWRSHFYGLTFLLFILAILSKAMAVSLPIVLFILDYFMGRKITMKVVLEKIPFIVLSIIFGCIAIVAQKSANAIGDIVHYNFFDRIFFSTYGLMMYLWKLIIPINLSCFYSYPVKQNGMYPTIFYIAPIVIFAIAFLIYQSKRFGKDILFGFGFFFITIALVLQILPVGAAVIADRYTYLPYIGLFFIIARGINNLLENRSKKFQFLKIPSIAILILFVLFFSFQAFQRTKVWHDSTTLWMDAIDKYDGDPRSYFYKEEVVRSYSNRGETYYKEKEYDKAIADFNSYIQLKNDNPNVYYNRAISYLNLHKLPEAIKDYTEAIRCKPDFSMAYYNRANAYFMLQNFQPAWDDALRAKQLGVNVDPRFMEAIQAGIKNPKQ